MPHKQSQPNEDATGRSTLRTQQRGTLYVVAVPIGHPDDITLRAIRVLSSVGLIASEAPAATQQLLTHHSIQTTITSYGPTNLQEKVRILIHRLNQGTDIALVSDCGSPLIADPGQFLVEAAHAQEISVVPIPGPSALIAAITVSGLVHDNFSFYGRLPTAPSHMTRVLVTGLQNSLPVIVFCTHQLATRALHILERVAPRRRVALACDLTMPTEQIIRGTPRVARERLLSTPSQDVTLVVARQSRRTRRSLAKRAAQSASSRRINTR